MDNILQIGNTRYTLSFRPTTTKILKNEFALDFRNLPNGTLADQDVDEMINLAAKLVVCLSISGRGEEYTQRRKEEYEKLLVQLDDFTALLPTVHKCLSVIRTSMPTDQDTLMQELRGE